MTASAPTAPPLGPTHPPTAPPTLPAPAVPAVAPRRKRPDGLSFWYGPIIIGVIVLALVGLKFAGRLGRGPDATKLADAAYQGAAAGVPTTYVAPPTTAPFDYLTPFLRHHLTDDAASLITFQPGTWNLSTEISRDVAAQVVAWQSRGMDECQLSLSISFADNSKRTVYPPLPDGRRDPDHVALVRPDECGAPAPAGPLPEVTTTTGGLR